MEPTRKGTPISMLHEDLLWKIFLEITNDALFYPFYPSRTENRPIVTIRYCSHVCDRWRSVILSSSMIWGRLIDMDYLTGRNTDGWMKEVVSRTGTALLWMYGTVDYQFPSDHFLFHFLRENWGRVQMLVVIESPHCLEHRKKMWDFLHRPAPRLQWVDLKLWFEDTEFLSRLLFADNAPLLTDFRIGNIRKFSTDTSWISNLCNVRFTYAFHPSEILEALRRIPRLKYLEVFIGNGAVDYRGPTIILPRLRMLQFHAGNFIHAGTFLQHIAPSADRCLSANVYLLEHMVDKQEYSKEYEAAIAKHFIPYSSLHPPSVVRFAVTEHIFTLGYNASQRSLRFVPVHGGPPQYRVFHITLHTPSLASSSFMEKLSSSAWFSQVTELDLGTWYSSLDFNQLGIIPTLRTFSSLKILSTNDVILHSLLRQPCSIITTLFPVLTTLQIFISDRSEEKWEEPPHHRLLRFRKGIGRPLAVFEITLPRLHKSMSRPSTYITDLNMGYLEVHSGLLVKWRTEGEGPEKYQCYRCGDGHPERLRFDLANP